MLFTQKTLYLILAAFVCLNNFSVWKREDRTSYSIQDTSWSWFYIEEKLCQIFCYWCFLCCSYDLQLSLSTTWHSANHNNSECLSKIFIPHSWTHGCVKIIRIMLSCIYYFSLISTEFCLPFYVWPLKITSSVHPFVVSVSFCHFEEFCSISKLCHLVKLLLFQIICNCDEKCRSYEASLLISIGNFFASWKLFNYPYTILPSFQLGLGFSPEIQLILDAVDKKFTQDFRSSDAKELNGVVFIPEKSHFSDLPESRSRAAKWTHIFCLVLPPFCTTAAEHSQDTLVLGSDMHHQYFPEKGSRNADLKTATSQGQQSLLNHLAVHSHVSPQAPSIPENHW